MDWWALQNEKADYHAKKYLDYASTKPSLFLPCRLWHELFYVNIQGQKVDSFDTTALYTTLREQQTISYWQQKHHLPRDSGETVVWDAAGQALRRLPLGLQRFQAKFRLGHIATACQMHLHKQ